MFIIRIERYILLKSVGSEASLIKAKRGRSKKEKDTEVVLEPVRNMSKKENVFELVPSWTVPSVFLVFFAPARCLHHSEKHSLYSFSFPLTRFAGPYSVFCTRD